jgi:hypothetical protein
MTERQVWMTGGSGYRESDGKVEKRQPSLMCNRVQLAVIDSTLGSCLKVAFLGWR